MRPVITHRRLNRAALLRSTALQAVVGLALAFPALAQPAPNARPLGGQVVAGSASIARTASSTTIAQSTNRAAIDWRGFDVGSQQSVTFQQPSSASVTLNRVTGGDPSAIAGRITANGQIVLTNRSGVTFYQGAQVNAQSVIVSAADISNQNFMAGRMVFDRAANPSARVENRGTITVKQAGLAALVAPSVANSGVIDARLGQVVLAGAVAHTLDMYGDGLVSIDVTKQVVQVPTGSDGKAVTALVTNTGIITADGGVVQLTATAADGVVQTLVRAGGHIRADTVGGRTGRIEVAGTGGSVVIEGRLAVDGRVGGEIMVAGSDTTVLAPSAHVTARGRDGGGTIAIGTTLARARGTGAAPAGTSARTLIASGARVSADATASGNGGRITVLSTQHTSMDGALTARGGKSGGDGGTIEMSGELGFSLAGTADTSAAHGASGTIVLDPRDLTISTTGSNNIPPVNVRDPNIAYSDGGTGTDAYVSPAQIQALTGNVHLQAARNLIAASSVTYGNGDLILEAGNNLTVNAGVSLTLNAGNLFLLAGSSAIPGATLTSTLSVQGALTAASITLNAGTGGIALGGTITAPTALHIGTTGALTQSGGSIQTANLDGVAASVSLPRPGNAITGVGAGASFFTTVGGVSLTTGSALTVGSISPNVTTGIGVPTGQTIFILADTLALASGPGLKSLSAPGGRVVVEPLTLGRGITLTSATVKPTGALALTTAELGAVSASILLLGAGGGGNIVLGQAGEAIDLTANGGFSTLSVATTGNVTQGGPLTVGTLSGQAGSLLLTNAGNAIPAIANLSVANTFSLTTAGPLNVTAPISANTLTLQAASIDLNADVTVSLLSVNTTGALTQHAGTLTADTLDGTAGSVSLTSPTNAVAGVATGFKDFGVTGAAGNFTLVDSVPLVVGSPSSTGGLFMSGGGIITLQANSLALNGLTYSGAPKVLSNPGGAIVLTPLTTGTDVVLTSGDKPTGSLSLNTTELGEISAGILRIGTLDAANAPTVRNIVLGNVGETIDLTANGTGIAELSLLASGAVVQGGPLTVGTLDGQAGSLSLPNTGNSVQTLAGFATTSGNLALSTRSGLLVSGTVVANGGAGDVTLAATGNVAGTDSNLSMLLTGDVTGVTVSLDTRRFGSVSTTGGISQTSGVITAATLTGAGYFASLGGNNLIQRLSDFHTFADLLVQTTLPLSITGAILSDQGTVTLNANGLTQTAGSSITANELDGTSTAATVLNSALNGIGSIGNFTQTGGDLAITSNVLLTLSGVAKLGFGLNNSVISGTGALTFTADAVALFSAAGIVTPGTVTFTPLTAGRRMELIGTSDADPNSLSLNQAFLNSIQAGTLQLGAAGATGPINIANVGETVTLAGVAGTLNLLTSGLVTEGSVGVLAVNTLTGITGGVNLGGANQIATLGAYTATGDLILQNAVPLLVAGPAVGTNSVQLLNTSTTTVSGDVTAPYVQLRADNGLALTAGTITASSVLNLDSFGAVTQSGGAITAGSLDGGAASVTLGGASNAIATLTQISGGTFTLADTRDLTIATFVTLDATSLTVAGNLTNTGVLTTGALRLNVSGAVTDTATSSETVTSLSGVVGLLNLGKGDPNASLGSYISTLGALTATGGVTLVNAGPLTIAGPVVDSGSISISAIGGLTVAASVTAPTIKLVTFDGPGGTSDAGPPNPGPGVLLQTAGTIGGTSITIASSDVLTLSGGVIAGGAGPVTLSSNGPLTLGNPITGGTVSLTARDKTTTDGLGVTTTIFGTINQPTGGSINAASLTGAADRAVSLLSGGNAISGLGGFASVGGFALADGQPLSVTGPVSDATSVTLSTTGPLSLVGSIQTGALNLVASGIAQTGGSVVAGSLTGSAGAAGAKLTQAGNRIGALLAFTSGGDLSVTDGTPVSIAGPVSAGAGHVLTLANDAPTFGTGGSLSAPGGTVALAEYTPGSGVTLGGSLGGAPPVNATTLEVSSAGGPIAITSAFDFSGVSVLDLEGGAIAETGVGSLRVATLTGHGASASLGGANQIGSLGLFTTTGGFALNNTAGLTVSGPLNASTASLTVNGDLVLASTISAPGAVSLTASGAITQPAGGIVAGSLSGSGASAALGAPGNRIATLAGFATTGDFSLFDGRSLTVTGPVDPNTVSLSVTGDLAINSVVTAGTVALAATGAITEVAGGRIVATMLTGTAASANLGAANRVATLAGFATSGAFGLTVAQGLTVMGPLTASTVGLRVTGDLALGGTLSAGSGVSLVVSGAITQPGGSITASSLSGNAASASLGAGGNQIAVLGGFNVTGAFALADTGGLAINGTLSGNAVSLATTGAITEGASGRIFATTLTGSAASAALDGGNSVTTLSGFTTASGFALANARALSVTGPVVDGQSIALSAVGPLTLAGTIQAPSVNLVSTSGPSVAGGINQTGGVISTATLTGSSTGLATLASAGNAVASLGGFGSVGGFKLTDGQSLSVTGPVSDPTSVALSVAGSLSLAGAIQTGALSLVASGGITQPGGGLVANSLTGSAGAAGAALTQGGNLIGTLLGFASLGDFSVTDGTPVAIAGAISAGAGRRLTLADDAPSFSGGALVAPGGTVTLLEFTPGHGLTLGGTPPVTAATLVVGSVTGGPIGITAELNLPNVPVLDLESAGAIAETGAGSLRVSTLTGHGASASLGGANQIGTLGLFATANGFALTNAAGLTVSGPLSASTASLNVTGDLALTGTVSAPGGVSLTASGAITQPGGGIVTGGLSGGAASASLGAAGNQVATLGEFTTLGAFALADARGLTVAGPLNASTAALAVSGDLVLSGSVSAPGGISLVASGAITQPGGAIVANSLSGSAASASLGAAGNQIATLGAFATTGAFALVDGRGLTVAGPLSGSTAGLGVTGDLIVSGTVSAPNGVSLVASGAITQPGGGITTSSLSGSAASASLGATGNQIAAVGGFTTTGAFALADAGGLTVSGPLNASNVGLNVTGDLALASTISALGGVSLVASGAITQPAGGIVTGSLSGNAASASLGASGNQVAALAGFVTSGDFALTDGRSLAVTGLVDPNTVSLAVTGDLALNSLVTGGTVALAATGAITEGATGQIVAATLTGSAASAGLGSANRVATLGRFSTTGAFALTDTQNLAVAGPLTASAVTLTATGDIAFAGNVTAGSLAVSTPGAVTQTGGSLAVTTLGGSAGGQIDLGGAGTATVANVAGLSSGTGVALVDGGPLRLSGTLSAPKLAITATGSLRLDGGTIVADSGFLQVGGGTASFQQVGTTVIQPLTHVTSTLRLGLAAPRSTMSLNGLYAPNSGITLSLIDGRVTGTLLAGNLSVLGSGGSASLTGSVASRFGVAAAIASSISPRVSQIYTLNGCAIGAVGCGPAITSILTDFQITSVLRPDILTLDILDLAVTRDRDDPTLVLPNISDRDY